MRFLTLLPKNTLSRWIGYLASLKLPMFFREPFLKAFGNFFGVNFSEIKAPLSSFVRLQDFFIRELKEGLRPVSDSPIVSPCDGVLGQCGQVQDAQMLQVKGRSYTLESLIGEKPRGFENASYATIYLSPKDYHRFHMPCDAHVRKARYIPGYLWPVNPWAVQNIDQLFCVNERIVCWLDDHSILVAVGATMVGKVKLRFDATLTTNISGSGVITREYPQAELLSKGQELGHFEFGSTIVLISKSVLKVSFGASIFVGASIRD